MANEKSYLLFLDAKRLDIKSVSYKGIISSLYYSQVQSLEITIEDESFVGMPFVLLSGGNWIKNSGSDFYVELNSGSMEVQKVALSPLIIHLFPYKVSLLLTFILCVEGCGRWNRNIKVFVR